MSRGGRGGAAAKSKSTIAGMARDLGVDRAEIRKLQTSGMQPLPLFPVFFCFNLLLDAFKLNNLLKFAVKSERAQHCRAPL